MLLFPRFSQAFIDALEDFTRSAQQLILAVAMLLILVIFLG